MQQHVITVAIWTDEFNVMPRLEHSHNVEHSPFDHVVPLSLRWTIRIPAPPVGTGSAATVGDRTW